MLAIIDYDAGNLRSVAKALEKLGETPVITRNPAEILSADHIILPGVGSFGDAMNRLHQYGLVDVIRKASASHIPFLGICLGLQLLFASSEETPGVEGLGICSRKNSAYPGYRRTENSAYGLEFSLLSQGTRRESSWTPICRNTGRLLCVLRAFLLFKSG